jgi:hypothetical protein
VRIFMAEVTKTSGEWRIFVHFGTSVWRLRTIFPRESARNSAISAIAEV